MVLKRRKPRYRGVSLQLLVLPGRKQCWTLQVGVTSRSRSDFIQYLVRIIQLSMSEMAGDSFRIRVSDRTHRLNSSSFLPFPQSNHGQNRSNPIDRSRYGALAGIPPAAGRPGTVERDGKTVAPLPASSALGGMTPVLTAFHARIG